LITRSILFVAVTVMAMATALQAAPAPPTADPLTQPWSGLTAKAGVSYDFTAKTTQAYHEITLKGKPVASHGTAPKVADATSLFSIDQKGNASDATPGYQLDIFSGHGTLHGDVFDALNLHELTFRPLMLGADWKGQSQVAGDLDGNTLNGAVGIERLPIHLQDLGLVPRNQTFKLANWLVPGVMASGEKGKTGTGIATYRAFLGESFGWTVSKSKKPPFDLDQFLHDYPDYPSVVAAGDALLAAKRRSYTPEEEFIIFESRSGTLNAGNYAAEIPKRFAARIRTYLMEPSSALWVESKGWYTFAGDPQGPRWKPLVALVLTFWKDSGANSRSSLSFRYQNGFDRTDPEKRVNVGMVSADLTF